MDSEEWLVFVWIGLLSFAVLPVALVIYGRLVAYRESKKNQKEWESYYQRAAWEQYVQQTTHTNEANIQMQQQMQWWDQYYQQLGYPPGTAYGMQGQGQLALPAPQQKDPLPLPQFSANGHIMYPTTHAPPSLSATAGQQSADPYHQYMGAPPSEEPAALHGALGGMLALPPPPPDAIDAPSPESTWNSSSGIPAPPADDGEKAQEPVAESTSMESQASNTNVKKSWFPFKWSTAQEALKKKLETLAAEEDVEALATEEDGKKPWSFMSRSKTQEEKQEQKQEKPTALQTNDTAPSASSTSIPEKSRGSFLSTPFSAGRKVAPATEPEAPLKTSAPSEPSMPAPPLPPAPASDSSEQKKGFSLPRPFSASKVRRAQEPAAPEPQQDSGAPSTALKGKFSFGQTVRSKVGPAPSVVSEPVSDDLPKVDGASLPPSPGGNLPVAPGPLAPGATLPKATGRPVPFMPGGALPSAPSGQPGGTLPPPPGPSGLPPPPGKAFIPPPPGMATPKPGPGVPPPPTGGPPPPGMPRMPPGMPGGTPPPPPIPR